MTTANEYRIEILEQENARLREENDAFKRADHMTRQENARLREERHTLASSIALLAKDAGIYNGDVPLTGPQLVMLAGDVEAELARLREENEYLRVKTAQYDQMVTEVETLLAALREIATRPWTFETSSYGELQQVARAAIAEVEGEK